MNGLRKLLVHFWCWRYNRRWLRRGEEEHFLQKLEQEQDTIRMRWPVMVADNARHRLKEG